MANKIKTFSIPKAEIVKYGNSHYIRVPSDFIKHGLVDPTKIYDIKGRESDGEEEENAV